VFHSPTVRDDVLYFGTDQNPEQLGKVYAIEL